MLTVTFLWIIWLTAWGNLKSRILKIQNLAVGYSLIHWVSKGQQLQSGKHLWELLLSLYQRSDCIVQSKLSSLRSQQRLFFKMINSSRKQTPDVALTGFLSGDCFQPAVWNSWSARKSLILWRCENWCVYLSIHYMIQKPIKMTASWLKFASLPRKRRKRLYDVEHFTCKFFLMRLLAFESPWPVVTRVLS